MKSLSCAMCLVAIFGLLAPPVRKVLDKVPAETFAEPK